MSKTVSIRFGEDGRIKKISPHAGPGLRALAKALENDNLRNQKRAKRERKMNEEYQKLLKVLELAEKVCDHHEADKIEKTNPDYIEVQLLKACREARKAQQEEYLGAGG